MAVTIEIRDVRPGELQVSVIEGSSRTTHIVTVDPAYCRKLTGGKADAAELVRRSFEFLLAREAKESILGRFALPVIGQYFPEYEQAMRRAFGS